MKFQASQAGLDMVRRVLQGHPSVPAAAPGTLASSPSTDRAAVIMTAILLVVAYLLGSLPFGLWLARSEGVDLRATGSGNIGATNVLRTTGRLLAAVVLALDSGKGLLAVWLAQPAERRDRGDGGVRGGRGGRTHVADLGGLPRGQRRGDSRGRVGAAGAGGGRVVGRGVRVDGGDNPLRVGGIGRGCRSWCRW